MFCVVCYDMGWNGEPRLPMSLDLREVFHVLGVTARRCVSRIVQLLLYV